MITKYYNWWWFSTCCCAPSLYIKKRHILVQDTILSHNAKQILAKGVEVTRFKGKLRKVVFEGLLKYDLQILRTVHVKSFPTSSLSNVESYIKLKCESKVLRANFKCNDIWCLETISPGIFEVLAFRKKTTYDYMRPYHFLLFLFAKILQQFVNNCLNVKLLKGNSAKPVW